MEQLAAIKYIAFKYVCIDVSFPDHINYRERIDKRFIIFFIGKATNNNNVPMAVFCCCCCCFVGTLHLRKTAIDSGLHRAFKIEDCHQCV